MLLGDLAAVCVEVSHNVIKRRGASRQNKRVDVDVEPQNEAI